MVTRTRKLVAGLLALAIVGALGTTVVTRGDRLSSVTMTQTVATASTEVGTFTVGALPQGSWLWISITTDATAVLSAFEINVKVNSAESAYTTYLSGTDFDTATSNMRFCTTTGPHELGAAATAVCCVWVNGVYAIQVKATASTAGDVTLYATVANE